MTDAVTKWVMFGGSTYWVKKITYSNIKLIYSFLIKKTGSKKTKRPRFSYSQLSKELGIDRKQVQHSCMLMAFRSKPLIKIHAMSFKGKRSVQCTQRVELLLIPPNKGKK